jgi:hypothetical protein
MKRRLSLGQFLCYGRNGMHGKQVEYSATVWDVIAIRVVECLSDGELIRP